jgi:hypothetical protein
VQQALKLVEASRRIFKAKRKRGTIARMQNDAITKALEDAVEEAKQLNQQAGAVLEKAIKAAICETNLDNDYRYKAATRMLDVYIRAHNVVAKYEIARSRELKKRRAH